MPRAPLRQLRGREDLAGTRALRERATRARSRICTFGLAAELGREIEDALRKPACDPCPSGYKNLFDAIRETSPSSAWSRGVELVRARAVTEEQRSKDEVSLRVETRGGLICPTVILYIENEDWECRLRQIAKRCAST